MVVEIEYYKGDVLLYGNDISKHDLKKQLIEVENSYDKLEDKITSYKKEQEKLLTEKNIIKQTYTKGIKKEEYKGYEDFEEKLKQDVDEYHIDPRDLEKEYEDKIQKIDSDLEKGEETHKFFCNDNNFKTITIATPLKINESLTLLRIFFNI